MEFAPGPRNREFDLSAYVAAGGNLVIGAVGTAHKGPVNTPTELSTLAEFIETFGNPITQAGLLAQIYLSQPGTLIFNRVVDTSAAKSTATIQASSVDTFTATAKEYGTYGNAISVKITAASSGLANEINIEEWLEGNLVGRFTDISSFTELAAVDSEYNDYAQFGAAVWPVSWVSGDYTTYTLTGGDSGLSSPDMSPYYRGSVAVNPGTPATGLHVFDDNKTYKPRVITCPGMYHPDVVADGLALMERRERTVFYPDAPDSLSADEMDSWTLGTYGGGPSAMNTSRGAVFYAWGEYADPYSDSDVYVAPSTLAVAALARSWSIGNPYMDPAGLTRGQIPAIKGLRYSPSDEEIAKTYSRPGHNVNWFVNFPGEGVYLWTQKTLQRASTALDRLNVRITLDIAQERLSKEGRRFIHEPNEQPTWDRIKATAEDVLKEIKANKGIAEYNVVCDDSINTAAVVERSETRCKISIRPMKSIEWLTFDWVLTNQSTSL